MSNYQVDICQICTSDLKSLNSTTTLELIKAYKQTQDSKVKEEVILGNLKLVLSIVSRYKNDDMNDLFQAGCIGLIKAIDQFDLGMNVMFSTYAVPLIIGEIKAFNRKKSMLHISRSMRDMSYKVAKIKEEYLSQFSQEIPKSMILNKLNISSFDLYQIESMNIQFHSLSEPKNGQEYLTLQDLVEDQTKDFNIVHNKICLENALKSLSKKEKWLIDQRYYCGKTQMEIAQELHISQAQISRTEKRILKRLKAFFI